MYRVFWSINTLTLPIVRDFFANLNKRELLLESLNTLLANTT